MTKQKLSKLHHDGHITDEEYDRLKLALNSLRMDELYQIEYENADSFILRAEVRNMMREMRHEIEANMESIVGKYDSSTPEKDRPSAKINRNIGRQECIDIINKHLKEITE